MDYCHKLRLFIRVFGPFHFLDQSFRSVETLVYRLTGRKE